MKNGQYVTLGGSTLTVRGDHSGIFDLEFDWVEEMACPECEPRVEPDEDFLVWDCEECGGGSSRWLSESRLDGCRRVERKTTNEVRD